MHHVLPKQFVSRWIDRFNKADVCGWASSKSAESQLDDLLKHAQFKYTFMSYNNEGLMPPAMIKNIMSKYGKYDVAETEYKRFKSSAGTHKANATTEFIHILEKP